MNPDQALVRRFLAAPHEPLALDSNPVARDLGTLLQRWDAARQELTVGFQAREQHVQGNGAVHGGIVSTMLDFALVLPALGLLEPPRVAVTVALTLHFERAVRPGSLEAVARIDRLGGRMVFASADLRLAGTGDVLARATGVLAIAG
ncbi:MAG: PaaI family thioesterase [Comamonadaceae bacterium]|nr:MAG: PaaI family thioesterase [Comamonadaceae bacterium]